MASSKIFSLEGKGLKLDSAEDIAPHIQELISNPDVEEVHFLGNTLGIGASEALAKVLEVKKELKIANLADIFTSRLLSEIPPALDALLKALLTLPNLHTVNLSDNAFGLNTQAPLVSFLSSHSPLQHLILNNNGLGPAAGCLIADALSELADKKAAVRAEGKPVRELETVVCGRNRLENGSMAAWAKAFGKHTGIKEVKMVQNGIRQAGISHLLREGLSHVSALRVLDLQDNTFTALGARVLSDVIGKWENLVELGVGDCFLSTRGGILLVEALRKGKNKKLEILRLQYNEINAKGIEGLAEAKSQLPRLRRVELNGNLFSEEDENIDRLREALIETKELVEKELGKEFGESDWGIDELDELDSEGEEEDEEGAESVGEEEEEVVRIAEKAAREIVETQRFKEQATALKKDRNVDRLAEELSKTEIK